MASIDVDAAPRRSTSSLDVIAVKEHPVDYEPMAGGIVSLLAAALLCLALFDSTSPRMSFIGTAFLSIFCAKAIFWGVAQIVGSRKASRAGANPQSPLLGTAEGCVFIGLILVLVTVLLYMFSRNHPTYSFVAGSASALFLGIGTIVGIRRGVWRG
jgi:hypothetical protein